MIKKFIATPQDDGQRLDKFLLKNLPQYSRAYLKDQIKLGNFLINNKRAKSSYVLRQDDEVSLAPGFSLPDISAIKLLPNPEIKFGIIYEDSDVAVIDKPAGLSVHPRQDKNGLPIPPGVINTLVNGLIVRWPEMASVGDNPLVRPGLVHRLDKDTSGVMVIAKTQASFEFLKKQFKSRLITKKYLALVHGCPKEKQGEIKCFLKRSPDPTKQQVAKDGREAISHYQVIQEFKNYSLVEVWPKTGRFHQIRVQLAHLGCPIVGDFKYGSKSRPAVPGLKRQFLHAQEIKIALPSEGQKTFISPLPTDLKSALLLVKN